MRAAKCVAGLHVLGFDPLGTGPTTLGRPRERSGPTAAFADVVAVTDARVVLEVGSWEGRSAALWAHELARSGDDWLLMCVDTWLGSVEMRGSASGVWSRERLYLEDQYPTVFQTFATNIRLEGYENHVVPIPIDSAQGYALLEANDIYADVVYVDAAHDFVNAWRDIGAALRRLEPTNPNAIVLCDDFLDLWPGVKEAVTARVAEISARLFTKEAQAAIVVSRGHAVAVELLRRGWKERVVTPTSEQLTEQSLLHVARVTEMQRQMIDEFSGDRRELHRLRRERRELALNLKAARMQMRVLRQQFHATRGQLDAVMASRSWRWTSWLRGLHRPMTTDNAKGSDPVEKDLRA